MTVQLRDFYGMRYPARHHPEIVLTAPNGEPVRVDVSIADMHLALWDAGVTTLASCGGDEERGAYIMFGNTFDMLNAVPIMSLFRDDLPEALVEAIYHVMMTLPEGDEQYVEASVDGWQVSRNFDVGGASSWHCAMHFPSADGCPAYGRPQD